MDYKELLDVYVDIIWSAAKDGTLTDSWLADILNEFAYELQKTT